MFFSVIDELQGLLINRYIPGFKLRLVKIFRSYDDFFFAVFLVVLLLLNSLFRLFLTPQKEKEKWTKKNMHRGILSDKAADFGKSLDDPIMLHGRAITKTMVR